MSKDTGDLSSTPVSDNKLCYTPEWDDDVHPHQFHMGFSPGVHGRGIFGVATGLTINFSFQFYLCMLVNQRENLTFGQKSHRAFLYAVVLQLQNNFSSDSSNSNINAPYEQILQTSD